MKKLEFGTAGIRAIIGNKENQLNKDSVYKVALAILKEYPQEKFVIGRDNRNKSNEFAKLIAAALAADGRQVYLVEDIIPSPMLSNMCLKMKCIGIMITASHNPKEYNGIKVYDKDGVQILPEVAIRIQNKLEKIEEKWNKETIDTILQIRKLNDTLELYKINGQTFFETYYACDLIDYLGDNLDALNDLKVGFSAQHGTATKFVDALAKGLEFEYHKVEEQCVPDTKFSKTETPNPEDIRAYTKLIKLGEEKDLDVLFTTDPDADRLGVVVKHKGKYEFLNGNQVATIILYALAKKNKNKDAYAIMSKVSTKLAHNICKEYNIKLFEVETGFKNVGDLIRKNGKENFLYGFEESYGSLIWPQLSMDKDSLQIMIYLLTLIKKLKTKNKTLVDYLNSIYSKFGYSYTTILRTKTIEEVKEIDNTQFEKGIDVYKEIRKSGTEPIVKQYIEIITKNKTTLKEVKNKLGV